MQLELTIVTPERRLHLLKLRQVVFQTPQGEAGVLPGHAALVTLVVCGIVRAFVTGADADDPPQCFVVGAGCVRAINDHLTLLAQRALREDELDAAAAEAELDEAEVTFATLDPVLDAEIFDEWRETAAFCEAVMALDQELSQRHPNLTAIA